MLDGISNSVVSPMHGSVGAPHNVFVGVRKSDSIIVRSANRINDWRVGAMTGVFALPAGAWGLDK